MAANKNNKINTILYEIYYLQNCKAVTLEKIQIRQKINNLMLQVIFIFSDWLLIKQIIIPLRIYAVRGKVFSKKCYLVGWVILLCLGCDGKT